MNLLLWLNHSILLNNPLRMNYKHDVKRIIAAACCMLIMHVANAQNFIPFHGTPYSGSMASDYNPAAALNSPNKWEITFFGLQGRNNTNGVKLLNIGLLSAVPDTLAYESKAGDMSRYYNASMQMHLMHLTYKLNDISALSFGINLKAVGNAYSSSFFYADSIKGWKKFFDNNRHVNSYSGNFQAASWVEYNLGYSRVISDDDIGKWQAGLELHINMPLAAAFGTLRNGSVLYDPTTDIYHLESVKASYGYSANVDLLDNKNSVQQNRKDFMQNSHMNLGFAAGVEYTRYLDDFSGSEVDENRFYAWKLGVALLDVGSNAYDYSNKSFVFTGFNKDANHMQLNKFDNVKNIRQLQDSLRTIGDVDSLKGSFLVKQPSRVVVNYDKYLTGNFYVNAEMQWHLQQVKNIEVNTRGTGFLSITPRWETKNLGVYLPFQLTTEGNFWIGLGFKAGPLVMGFDNLAWLLGKKGFPNGGGYLALQIRPWKRSEKEVLPCPK